MHPNQVHKYYSTVYLCLANPKLQTEVFFMQKIIEMVNILASMSEDCVNQMLDTSEFQTLSEDGKVFF